MDLDPYRQSDNPAPVWSHGYWIKGIILYTLAFMCLQQYERQNHNIKLGNTAF